MWVSFYERSFLALSESLTMSNRCWILETWKSLPRKNARRNRQRRGILEEWMVVHLKEELLGLKNVGVIILHIIISDVLKLNKYNL